MDRIIVIRQSPAMELHSRDLEEHRQILRSYLRKRMSDDSEIEDVIQESFIRFLMCENKSTISSPQSYLYRIARNLLIDRSRRRSPLTGAAQIDEQRETGFEPPQEHGRHLADLEQAYGRALSELPPRCREVFLLRRHDEMPTPDVAQRLSISHRMVQKYIARATSHLHDRLQPFLCEAH